MIGIIVADENEINELPFEKISTKRINQFKFHVYDCVVIVHSGIGIANAASATQCLIDNFDIKQIFNYGAVGGNELVDVYDIITPTRIFYHDVITPWYQRGQTPKEDKFYINKLISTNNNNLASGSSFIYKPKDIKEIKKDLDVDIFDMETAGIAQIAKKNNIPINVIKCVSDSIGNTKTNLENINTRIKNAGKIAFDKTILEIKKIIN